MILSKGRAHRDFLFVVKMKRINTLGCQITQKNIISFHIDILLSRGNTLEGDFMSDIKNLAVARRIFKC